MNPTLDTACTTLATELMFGKGFKLQNLEKVGLQLRKNKTLTDIDKAVRKGFKNGHARTEIEIEMISLYLSQVLKLA